MKKNILILMTAILGIFFVTVTINQFDFNLKELSVDSGFDSGGGSSSSSSSSGGGSGINSGGSGGNIYNKKITTFEKIYSMFLETILTTLYLYFMIDPYSLIGQRKKTVRKIFIVRAILFIIAKRIYSLTFVVVMDAIGTTIAISRVSNNKVNTNYVKFNTNDVSAEQLKTYGIKENINELKMKVYDVYVEIQEAWSVNKIDKARHLLSDEMYNTYKMQIMTMINKNQRNAMGNFRYVNAYINEIQQKGNEIIIKTSLNVHCKDYMINTKTGNVIKGNSDCIHDYYYSLTFILGKIDSIKNCPNCNADLSKFGISVQCDYCGSVIDRESDELVLIDKKMAFEKQVTK